jgi:hypothetical protein
MASGRKAKIRAPQPMWSWHHWHERVLTIAMYTTLESAIEHSYAAFVRSEGYTDAIRMPDDDTRLRHSDLDRIGDEDQRDTLSEAWDEWLLRHPEQRATWDTESREARLRALEAQHVQLPRPFTSASVVANPAWYHRIYGLLGMTDEQFDTLLHLHRFAIAQKEAQRLAEEQEQERGTQGRARQKRPSAAIYLQGFSYQPDYPIVSLEIQERACRAYCKRMGYKVHKVYRAMTPPPDNVPLHLEIGIAPGRAFEYYRSESDHPYHAVHNLLYARNIDLIVEFTESGPSHSRYGASLDDESSRLLRTEMASLWEIEPPTEDERRLDELLTQLSHAEAHIPHEPLLIVRVSGIAARLAERAQ